MRLRVLVAFVLLLCASTLYAQSRRVGIKWIATDPRVSLYVFRADTRDDVGICVELPGKVIGCASITDLRAITKRVDARTIPH